MSEGFHFLCPWCGEDSQNQDGHAECEPTMCTCVGVVNVDRDGVCVICKRRDFR